MNYIDAIYHPNALVVVREGVWWPGIF